jgi:hypothetical protein
MNPRTNHPLESSFRPGYTHPAGSEVILLEPLDQERRLWMVELRVPDARLEGDAWYDHAELSLNELDFSAEVQEDMRVAEEAALPKERPHLEDTTVARGSHELPRKAA